MLKDKYLYHTFIFILCFFGTSIILRVLYRKYNVYKEGFAPLKTNMVRERIQNRKKEKGSKSDLKRNVADVDSELSSVSDTESEVSTIKSERSEENDEDSESESDDTDDEFSDDNTDSEEDEVDKKVKEKGITKDVAKRRIERRKNMESYVGTADSRKKNIGDIREMIAKGGKNMKQKFQDKFLT